MKKTAKRQGALIVIDGADGSGKTTQIDLLKRRLRREGYRLASIKFPQYRKPSSGPVRSYLAGHYGKTNDVDPYLAATFYAIDRYDGAAMLRKKLSNGAVVVSDRYVSGNVGHQGAKLKTARSRKKFIAWLNDLEYRMFKIPRPRATIILDVPDAVRTKLIAGRGGRHDMHDADPAHLKAAARAFREYAVSTPGVHLIKSAKNGQLLPPTAIHEKIWKIVENEVKTQKAKGKNPSQKY